MRKAIASGGSKEIAIGFTVMAEGVKAYLLCSDPPERPANVEYTCLRELYLAFEAIFLGKLPIKNACGHDILVFDHHFFHLAAITVDGVERLYMRDEKQTILGLAEGFGNYDIGKSRAKHLRSVHITLSEPDEVWEDNPKARAKWTYVKEFASQPYQFSVALVAERSNENFIIFPVSGFPCKRSDVRKWRQGTLIYAKNNSKNTTAAG